MYIYGIFNGAMHTAPAIHSAPTTLLDRARADVSIVNTDGISRLLAADFFRNSVTDPACRELPSQVRLSYRYTPVHKLKPC